MPYTKRKPHYGSPKDLIEYALDEKNNGKKVAAESSINCDVNTALYEFMKIQKKFKMNGNRVAYHVIQSFSPLDNITPQQANEIGKKVCKEIYPDFQCVISTHTDRGHIHNHIVINAINLHGRKLEDRLSNSKEGLYGLSNVSDRISSEYGCFVMPKRTFKKVKNKDFYYQYKSETWKNKIRKDVKKIINRCTSIDEFFDQLSLYGYDVKRGKHISVKCIGMKRFARLSTISPEYSFQNLCNYFKKHKTLVIMGIKSSKTNFNYDILELAQESKNAIEKSQIATENKTYNEYQKTRYLEIKRYYSLKEQLEFLNLYNINSFDDLELAIDNKRQEIKNKNILLKKKASRYEQIVEKTEKAQDYIKMKKACDYELSYKKIDPSYKISFEAKVVLQIQNELNINSIDEAKKLIKNYRNERIEINKTKRQVLELQQQLSKLDTIKEEKLSNSNLYIHNIKFGANRINYKLSNDDVFCLNLPYTHETLRIPKKYTAYNSKHRFYTLFLVDDKKYIVFDEENKKVKEYTGKELEQHVLDKKKEIDKSYNN